MLFQKVIRKKNCVKKLFFCWHLEGLWRIEKNLDLGSGSGSESGSISQRHGSADPDPPQNVMDPQHCIAVKSISVFYIIFAPFNSICFVLFTCFRNSSWPKLPRQIDMCFRRTLLIFSKGSSSIMTTVVSWMSLWTSHVVKTLRRCLSGMRSLTSSTRLVYCIAGQCRTNPWPAVLEWSGCRNANVGLTQFTNRKNTALTFFPDPKILFRIRFRIRIRHIVSFGLGSGFRSRSEIFILDPV